jgi:hypothetical protein
MGGAAGATGAAGSTRRRMLDLLLAGGAATATSLSGQLPVTRQAVAKLPPDDRWAQIANWFLAVPAERMISPYSKVKVSSYVQRRIKANTKLQEAVVASPADALARARFGVKLLTDSRNPNASVQADAETLFATLLAPGNSEVWQARVKVLEALKRTVEADVARQKAASLAATAK